MCFLCCQSKLHHLTVSDVLRHFKRHSNALKLVINKTGQHSTCILFACCMFTLFSSRGRRKVDLVGDKLAQNMFRTACTVAADNYHNCNFAVVLLVQITVA